MAIQRASLVNMTVDELVKLIRDRGLRAQDPLPSTADLAEQLDVSRTVVREAIAELAGQGLLHTRQGRETLVALPDSPQFERLLRLRFAVRGDDFANLQDFRSALEVGASRLAAERARPDDVARLQHSLAELKKATGGDALHLKDQAFHREIARISGNDMMILTLDGIAPLFVDLRRHAWAGWVASGRGLRDILRAHEVIYEKIRENDAAGAAAAMLQHMLQAMSGLESDRETRGAVPTRSGAVAPRGQEAVSGRDSDRRAGMSAKTGSKPAGATA